MSYQSRGPSVGRHRRLLGAAFVVCGAGVAAAAAAHAVKPEAVARHTSGPARTTAPGAAVTAAPVERPPAPRAAAPTVEAPRAEAVASGWRWPLVSAGSGTLLAAAVALLALMRRPRRDQF